MYLSTLPLQLLTADNVPQIAPVAVIDSIDIHLTLWTGTAPRAAIMPSIPYEVTIYANLAESNR